MSTSMEQFGQLHTNYNDFSKSDISGFAIDKSSFHNFIISILKGYENTPLALNQAGAGAVHDAGNPTIGYGFDLGTWGDWAPTKALFIKGVVVI